ncbi:MAG: hypothetical protein ACI4F5_06460 [Acutalibacteraceae bacterium]
MDIARIKKRVAYLKNRAEKIEAALDALIDGGAQSYTIDDRTVTKFDITKLEDELEKTYSKLDELESRLHGKKSRKAVGAVPRDW